MSYFMFLESNNLTLYECNLAFFNSDIRNHDSKINIYVFNFIKLISNIINGDYLFVDK